MLLLFCMEREEMCPSRTIWPSLYPFDAMVSPPSPQQPHKRGFWCVFVAFERVSTNAEGCSWNISLLTGITGTTVSKLLPAKPLATMNIKIMDRICINMYIFRTFVIFFSGLISFIRVVRLSFVFYVHEIFCLRSVLSLKTSPALLWYFQRNYNLIIYICPGFNIIRKAYGYAY